MLAAPVLGVIVLAWGWWALSLPRRGVPPIGYLDIDGREITSFESESGRVQIWMPLEHIPPAVAAAVIAAEDRRFMRHHGVDLLAVARAAVTHAREAHVVRRPRTRTQPPTRRPLPTRARNQRPQAAES